MCPENANGVGLIACSALKRDYRRSERERRLIDLLYREPTRRSDGQPSPSR